MIVIVVSEADASVQENLTQTIKELGLPAELFKIIRIVP
jgi:hypothetical protein